MNWIDIILVAILIGSVAGGVARGFARSLVGLAALLIGLFFACWTYGIPAHFFEPFMKNARLANLMGFLTVFVLIQIIGGLIGWMIQKMVKAVGLSWLDRVLGAGFGVLKAALLAMALLIAFTAFPVNMPPVGLAESQLAPPLLATARVLVELTPRSLRDSFAEQYEQIKKIWNGEDPKKPQSESV